MPKNYNEPGLSGRKPDMGSSVESSGNKPSRPPRTHTYKSGPTAKIGQGVTTPKCTTGRDSKGY